MLKFNQILFFSLFTTLSSVTAHAADKSVNFTYKGYSAGLLAARASGSLDTANNRFVLALTATDAGISSLFKWNSKVNATGGVFPNGIAPDRFNLQNKRRGRSSSRALTYRNGQANVKFGSFTPIPADEAIAPSATNGSMDPASAFMAILNSVEQNGTCSFSVRVFEGKSLYRFDVRRVGTENISDLNLAYNGNATRCRITPIPLAGKTMRPKNREGLTSLDLWIAKPILGGPMLPVKMAARVKGISVALLMTSANYRTAAFCTICFISLQGLTLIFCVTN